MNDVNTERMYKTFAELTAVDSLSLEERELADLLKKKLEVLGADVTEDDTGVITGSNAGNILARIKPSDIKDTDTVLFSAHMDTVEPGCGKKAIRHNDGRITSGGTTVLGADDAAGITEILEAVEEILEEGIPHHGLELLFTTGEELYTVGASAFDTSKLSSKRAYFLDRAGDMGSATITEPTLISFEVTVEGRASHAGFEPEKGINAIVIASRAIASLPVGRKDDNTTLAVGIIEGGIATNVVPATVKIKGEIRSQIHEEALKTLEEVKAVFAKEASEAGAKSKLDYKMHLTAYSVPDTSDSLAEYKKVLKQLGIKVSLERSFGGSDCNPFRRQGIDGLCFANAMWGIHSTEEYTTLDDMSKVVDIVKNLMRA